MKNFFKNPYLILSGVIAAIYLLNRKQINVNGIEKKIYLTNKEEIKKFAEKILKGLNFKYIGFSQTNFGNSMYFEVNNIKLRFSDHSVQNLNRIKNEIFFSINDINNEYTKFINEQSLLNLKYELNDKSIIYGKRPMLMRSGKIIDAFGYTEIK